MCQLHSYILLIRVLESVPTPILSPMLAPSPPRVNLYNTQLYIPPLSSPHGSAFTPCPLFHKYTPSTVILSSTRWAIQSTQLYIPTLLLPSRLHSPLPPFSTNPYNKPRPPQPDISIFIPTPLFPRPVITLRTQLRPDLGFVM